MDKPCGICGSVNNQDVMACCSQCNIAREHVYCMRVLIWWVPEEWFCDECQLRGVKGETLGVHNPSSCDILPYSDDVPPETSPEPCFKKKKITETGKVKLISPAEVRRLSSGATKAMSPTRTTFTSRTGPSSGIVSMSRTHNSRKVVSSKFPPPKVKANPSFYPSGCLKPPRNGCEQVKSVTNRPESQSLNELEVSEPKTSLSPAKDHIYNEGTLASSTPGKETGTSNTKTKTISCKEDCVSKDPSIDAHVPAKEVLTSPGRMKTLRNKGSCTSSPSNHCLTPPIISPDVLHAVPEVKSSNNEGRGPLSFIPHLFLPYCPAQDVTWKGGFKILDGGFYDGFWGHPPIKVHHKAYEFSKTLHPVLEVKFVPRCHMWTKLFQDDNPDFHDIALYFLPGDHESSEDNNTCLLALMEHKDLAMETCIDGVELLIFTSTKLHENPENVMTKSKDSAYLWGVFRPAREYRTVESVHANDANMSNGDDDIDMEIDMLGGEIVGSVDVPVPREPSLNDAKNMDSTIEQLKLEFNRRKDPPEFPHNIKREFGAEHMHGDVPPGFERLISVKEES